MEELETWTDGLGRLCTGDRGVCELRLDGFSTPAVSAGAAVDATTVKVSAQASIRYTWAAADMSTLRKQVSVFFVPGSTTQSIRRDLFAPGYKSMIWVKARTQLTIGVRVGSPSATGAINRNKMGISSKPIMDGASNRNNIIGRTSSEV